MLVAPYSSSWLSTYAIRNNIIYSEKVELIITDSLKFDEQMTSGQFPMGAMSAATFAINAQYNQYPYKALCVFITGKGSEEARGINLVCSKAGSSINSPTDLIGKTIGVPGLQSSSTSVFLGMMKNKYGISEDQLTLVNKSNSLLIELLRKGELDAALLGSNVAPEAYYSDEFQIVWNLDQAFKEEYGEYYSPSLLLVNTTFYENNTEAVKAAYELLIASRDYAKSHVEELTAEYANEFGAGLPAEFYAKIQKYHSTASFDRITGKTMDCVMAVFQLVKDRGIIETIPDPDKLFIDW